MQITEKTNKFYLLCKTYFNAALPGYTREQVRHSLFLLNQEINTSLQFRTKFSQAYAIPNQKSRPIANLFVDNFICMFGVPQSILDGEATNFMSQLI